MQEGELIAGKYRIDRTLGQGGMGTVVAATNLHLDQRVALKFLLPELVGEKAVVERFLREARASARLRSEHICRVYDVGVENGAPFIVMELLEGCDLASMLASVVSRNRKLSVATAADYVLQATMGLAEAHALGIVHRDLKPANLFVTKRLDGTPLVKILDFGIAKAPSDTKLQLTRTAAVMGSPGYMSPEQLRSARDADARSDIWALGVILFELVSGAQPFAAESITELALRVAMDPTPPLPGVPRDFERVVARCLEKDPGRRYANVAQLAAALAPFGSERVAESALSTATLLSTSATLGAGAAPGAPAAAAPSTLGSSAGSLASITLTGARLRWGLVGIGLAAALVTVAVVKLREPGASAPGAVPAAPGAVAPAAPGAAQPREPKPAAAAPETAEGSAGAAATAAVDAGVPAAAAAETTPTAPTAAAPSAAKATTTSPAATRPQPPAAAQPSPRPAAPPPPKPRTKPTPPPQKVPPKDIGESRE